MDETNQKCKSRKRSRETDRSATTRTRVEEVLSVSYHSCSGKDSQLSKGPPTARITVANPPFSQWIARNPSLAKQLFGYAILGFALTEAIALFALMMAFLILFVF